MSSKEYVAIGLALAFWLVALVVTLGWRIRDDRRRRRSERGDRSLV